jgi:hypothetical protein
MKLQRSNPPDPKSASPAALDPVPAVTRRRVELTVEREWARESFSSSSLPPASFEALCSACGVQVLMVSPAAAAKMAGVSVRMIYRWVDEDKLHFLESPAGDLYLCARSLEAPPQSTEPTKQLPSGDPR